MPITGEAIVDTDGRVTIPKEIRDEIDIDEGTTLEFVLEADGQLAVRPGKSAMERLRSVRDALSTHDVDLDEVRRQSKTAWEGHGAGVEEP